MDYFLKMSTSETQVKTAPLKSAGAKDPVYFSIMSFSMVARHFISGLFNPKIQPRTFQLQRIEYSIVEKSGVEEFMV